MFITLQDAIVQIVTLGAPSTGLPSTGVPSSARSGCNVEIFSSVTFFIMEGKKCSQCVHNNITILRIF